MQEGILTPKINYNWIEIAPMLILLFLVVIALAIIPNCLDRDSCINEYPASPSINIEKLSEGLSNTDNLFSVPNVEKP